MDADQDLARLRGHAAWRLGVWGLRLELLAVVLIIAGAVVLAVTSSAALIGAGFGCLAVGLIGTLICAGTVSGRTASYSGVSSGNPSPPRMWNLVRALIADVGARRS